MKDIWFAGYVTFGMCRKDVTRWLYVKCGYSDVGMSHARDVSEMRPFGVLQVVWLTGYVAMDVDQWDVAKASM